MPGYNRFEIHISGKKYQLQTNETQEHIKKIESIINNKINEFKTTDKKFDNYSSLIFTTFVITDKYLKAIQQLETEKKINENGIRLTDYKALKDEFHQTKQELEHTISEKDQYLQELIQKNSEMSILKNRLALLEKQVKEMQDEITILEEVNQELENDHHK